MDVPSAPKIQDVRMNAITSHNVDAAARSMVTLKRPSATSHNRICENTQRIHTRR